MTNSKRQLLKKMNPPALKALEVIAQNPQGITVKELIPILQSVNSTVHNLLGELCEFNFLVRVREGKNGSYLYYLHPSVDPELIQGALETSSGKKMSVFSSLANDGLGDSILPSSTKTDLSEVNEFDQSLNVSALKKMVEEAIGEQERAFEKFKKIEKVLNQFDV
jgi:predicted transcriptional regulator